MNDLYKYLAYGLGSLSVLGGSFLVFTAATGRSLSDMPLVGGYLSERETGEEPAPADLELEDQLRRDQRTPVQTLDAAASPLRAFLLPTGFSASELEELEQALQSRMKELDLRAKELDAREKELVETQRHYEDLYERLEQLRTTLLDEEAEVAALKQEAERDRLALAQQEAASYAKMAAIFQEGKAKDSARLLVEIYAPEEAARILNALDEERAGALLSAIHGVAPDRSKEYHQAYRVVDR